MKHLLRLGGVCILIAGPIIAYADTRDEYIQNFKKSCETFYQQCLLRRISINGTPLPWAAKCARERKGCLENAEKIPEIPTIPKIYGGDSGKPVLPIPRWYDEGLIAPPKSPPRFPPRFPQQPPIKKTPEIPWFESFNRKIWL